MYKYLEHTSDLFIESKCSHFSHCIESIADGLFRAISDLENPQDPEVIEFEEEGLDLEDLIINLFTRVLAEMDASGKVGSKLEVLSLEKNSIKVRLTLVSSPANLHVKAVTFHGFHADDHTLRVLFDI